MAESGTIFYFDWEMRFMEWFQGCIGSEGLGCWLLSNLSALGEQLLLIAIMGYLYWGKDKAFGRYVGLNVLMVNVWNPLIKNIVLRLRPYFVPGYDVALLRPIDSTADITDVSAQGYSFPSTHSAGAVAVYGSMAAHEKKKPLLWILAVLLPLAVGISRVFVGAHFPTDVLCGWLLGILALLVVSWLRRIIRNKALFYLVIVLTCLPGFFYCRSEDFFTSAGLLFGFIASDFFEEKYVNFENTSSILRCVLRTLVGGLLFIAVSEGLKLPFPKELLEADTYLAYILRTLRYALTTFLLLGVYPLLFRVTGKLWEKKEHEPQA